MSKNESTQQAAEKLFTVSTQARVIAKRKRKTTATHVGKKRGNKFTRQLYSKKQILFNRSAEMTLVGGVHVIAAVHDPKFNRLTLY